MKILLLTQVLPYPLDAGPKTRAYFVLRHLAQTHDVVLVSFVRETDTPEAMAHLGELCEAVYVTDMRRSRGRDAMHLMRSLVTTAPFIIQRDRVQAMDSLLGQVVCDHGPFDAVHADQLWMAPYALAASKLHEVRRRPLTVLDQHNAVFMIPGRLAEGERNPAKRALLEVEAKKMARFEADACRRFDRVVWVTEEDYDAVNGLTSSVRVELPKSAVIPICTDPSAQPPLVRVPGGHRVTFLGGLHYPPNAQGVLWFAQDVFPRVLRQAPDALLTVIGKQPPSNLEKLGFPAASLDVLGYVPDPTAYLRETAAFVVPLHSGGGMRVKILDAWTWGLPIVSTSIGAEGIEVSPEADILIGDDPASFAAHTVGLLKDAEQAEQVALAGRKTVETRYDWRTRYRAWDAVYA